MTLALHPGIHDCLWAAAAACSILDNGEPLISEGLISRIRIGTIAPRVRKEVISRHVVSMLLCSLLHFRVPLFQRRYSWSRHAAASSSLSPGRIEKPCVLLNQRRGCGKRNIRRITATSLIAASTTSRKTSHHRQYQGCFHFVHHEHFFSNKKLFRCYQLHTDLS